MTKLKPITADSKADAKGMLQEAIDQEPDSVIVLCFWKDSNQFKIKTSAIPYRLTLIGAIEEAKNKILVDGYIRNEP